jgi:3-dehydrosphinganine reductase
MKPRDINRILSKRRSHSPLKAGRHAVITGGSSGLGLALAEELARRHLQVTLIARDRERLDAAADRIRAAVPEAVVRLHSIDVADADAVASAIDDAAADAGGIDMLINSAGILREGYFEELSDTVFRTTMDINFFGIVNTTRAALGYLKQSGGRIVNIGSLGGLMGGFGLTAYGAAKHALTGFSESLRLEVEPQGVTVQLACPAEFDSPMVDVLNTYRTPENRAVVTSFPVLGIDQVTREVIAGIERGDPLIIPGSVVRMSWRVARLAPGLVRRLLQRKIAGVYRGPSSAVV